MVRRCLRCGALLASDHRERVCSPCERRARNYDPRCDPDFVLKLVALFAGHRGETVEPLKRLSIADEHRNYVKDTIKLLRRAGYDIRARERLPGYVYMGEVTDLSPSAAGRR